MNKLQMIEKIVEVHEREANAEEGEKHLSSTGYAMEAISAVLSDWPESPIVCQFLES